MAEAMGNTPLDFLFLDRQHGSPVTDELEHLVRAADLAALPIFVRVPKDDLTMVTYLFDTGVSGVMLPQVEDTAIVREAATHTRFEAGRSLSTGSRAATYGGDDREAYIDFVNTQLALVPQIETTAGVDAVEEITGMDEVTAIAIGPGDLAKSLGVDMGDPDHRDAIERIFDIAAENDCKAGIFVGSPSDLQRYADKAAYMIYRSDISIVTAHLSEILDKESP
jgi:2-keto-3-deoxy-L-rhamnonate aldolase RhmA